MTLLFVLQDIDKQVELEETQSSAQSLPGTAQHLHILTTCIKERFCFLVKRIWVYPLTVFANS